MSPARERLLVVLLLLAVGGAVVLASTQTFSTVDVVGARRPITVPGQQAAPALAPLGLVALALAGALSIAGRGARLVLGVVLVLVGAAVLALVVPSVLDPAAGTAGAVSAATGVTDVDRLVRSRQGSGWPAFAAVAGASAGVLGLIVLIRARRWTTGGRRFRASAPVRVSTDPVEEWDALTKGTDPTADPLLMGSEPSEPSEPSDASDQDRAV